MQIFRKDRILTSSWALLPASIRLLSTNIWQVLYLSFLPTLLLVAGLTMIADGENLAAGSRLVAGGIVIFVAGLWLVLAYAGYIYMQAQAARGISIDSKPALLLGLRRTLPLMVASALSSVMIIIGLLCFIIPGLILIRSFLLVPYYVVDKQLGPTAALRASYADTAPVSAWIWGVLGVQFVFGMVASNIGSAGGIGPVISLIITYLYAFAPALRYVEVNTSAAKE